MKKTYLFLLLTVLSLLLCACGDNAQQTAEVTAEPAVQTLAPDGSNAEQVLSDSILASVSDITPLLTAAQEALPEAYTALIPAQAAQTMADAVLSAETLTLTDGEYKISLSSGGDFEYEKPYSSLIYGDNVDEYTIESDDGTVEETVENVYHDPLSYVLSGTGGGEFSYASYYLVRADGQRGKSETVSRLNAQITGFSHTEFARSGSAFYFVDAQLSLEANQTDGPYTWTICVGATSADAADLFEFTAVTQTLALPTILPAVYEQGTASAEVFAETYAKTLVSHFTVSGGQATLKTQDGELKAEPAKQP